MFPGDLLESTYPDPDDPEKVKGRSEVERRRQYIEQLEREFRDGENHPLPQMVKQCLRNDPSRRPTTEQLVNILQGLRVSVEGPYGSLARIDAVKQVVMMKEILAKETEVNVALEAKDSEIQQLQLAKVCYYKSRFSAIHIVTSYSLQCSF